VAGRASQQREGKNYVQSDVQSITGKLQFDYNF
jgi:hypothetical protein